MSNFVDEINGFLTYIYHLDPKRRSVTVVLNKTDAFDLISKIYSSKYDNLKLSYKGEYLYISSCNYGDTSLFAESIVFDDGTFKYDETDILIVPQYVPENLKAQLYKNGYDVMVIVDQDITKKELLNKIN